MEVLTMQQRLLHVEAREFKHPLGLPGRTWFFGNYTAAALQMAAWSYV